MNNRTLKNVDRIFGGLLILAGLGHTAGTILWTEFLSGIFVWSMGSALAAILLGVLNIVRAGRPQDKTLAAITVIGTFAWIFVTFGFSLSIHNLADPRPLGHEIISAVLLIFGIASLRSGQPHPA
jgi:hypothetical protein